MKANEYIICPKCGAPRDYVQADNILFGCYSALYSNTHQPMTISTNCLQRQIDQLNEKLGNALEQLINK